MSDRNNSNSFNELNTVYSEYRYNIENRSHDPISIRDKRRNAICINLNNSHENLINIHISYQRHSERS